MLVVQWQLIWTGSKRESVADLNANRQPSGDDEGAVNMSDASFGVATYELLILQHDTICKFFVEANIATNRFTAIYVRKSIVSCSAISIYVYDTHHQTRWNTGFGLLVVSRCDGRRHFAINYDEFI